MDTSRDDVGIAIRSALLHKGTKQKFSLFALVIASIILIFLETIEILLVSKLLGKFQKVHNSLLI